MRRATVLVTLVLMLLALAVALTWAFNTGSASPDTPLTCDVKTSCDEGEVELLSMSGTTNAHAASIGTYPYRVCCGGLPERYMDNDCSANYDTILALSGIDNAHVATEVGGAYSTEVCLSLSHEDGVVNCMYGTTCETDYECLATISGSTNAHIADCDGTYPYETKVCCQAYCIDDLECDCMPDDYEDLPPCLDPTLDDALENADDDKVVVHGTEFEFRNFAEMLAGTDPCVSDSIDDTDSDGFNDNAELLVGTDPLDDCPDALDDDAWPPDINDGVQGCGVGHDGNVNILDVLCYKPVFLTDFCEGQYDRRYDFNGDGSVNILDVLLYKWYINTSCANP